MAEAGLACRPFLRQSCVSKSNQMGSVLRKSIFITGGGSGIGRATAQHFAAKGWFVGLADVNAKGLAETAALLPEGASSQHMFDVRDRDQWVSALADFATKSGGRMDVLFNNAGIAVGGPLIDTSPEDIERVLDINLKSLFWGAQVGFPYLKATPGSALINTSSAAGLYAGPGMAGYAAAKFGVRALTESLDQEWHNDGIKVASIMPSFIDTPLLDAHASGSNRQTRDVVRDAGLEFTPVEQVAQTVWDAVDGNAVHNVVGKTARRIKFMSRWAPGVLRKQGKGQRGLM
jgi:NAD(P)-dependent dehydrogenase (short-subunit alcohol dehydrogenase family)